MSHMDALPLCPPRPNPPYLGGRYASFLSFPYTTTKPSTEDILFIFPTTSPESFIFTHLSYIIDYSQKAEQYLITMQLFLPHLFLDIRFSLGCTPPLYPSHLFLNIMFFYFLVVPPRLSVTPHDYQYPIFQASLFLDPGLQSSRGMYFNHPLLSIFSDLECQRIKLVRKIDSSLYDVLQLHQTKFKFSIEEYSSTFATRN